jgi:hypothetical protein
MYFNNLKEKKYAISCFIRYYLSQIKACNVQHNNESKNIMLILNKSHSHTNASFFIYKKNHQYAYDKHEGWKIYEIA